MNRAQPGAHLESPGWSRPLHGARSLAGALWRDPALAPSVRALLALYLFIYLWSVPMLMFDLVPTWGSGMGGFLLILQGALVAIWLANAAGIRGAIAAGAILLGSYLVEYVGVTQGVPFGQYRYTGTLGLQLGGSVPLAIPFAWLMVVPGAVMTVARLRRTALVVPLAALLATLLDLLIEPVAAYVIDYWQWIETGPYYGIPTTNFLAWGGTALVLAYLLWRVAGNLHRQPPVAWLPPLLFTLNAGQFTLVNAARGFWWPVLVGGVLLLLVWRLRWRRTMTA
ncbi:MAG TPA: carotenoid biosynthesis protein [Herpetosiphonaceae bacterium]|nr:carotenoid biosynthesis protein [Herpetosiphonaceae bacterium]